mmetsp:Transcript_4667/g.18684  ORF Transcript_4667/g.18684 Transcript_4667/m.18684 type:complete len:275 (+) Transcript_4667:3922-4746(+)
MSQRNIFGVHVHAIAEALGISSARGDARWRSHKCHRAAASSARSLATSACRASTLEALSLDTSGWYGSSPGAPPPFANGPTPTGPGLCGDSGTSPTCSKLAAIVRRSGFMLSSRSMISHTASASAADLHRNCAVPSPCEPTPLAPCICGCSAACARVRWSTGATSSSGHAGPASASNRSCACVMSAPSVSRSPAASAASACATTRSLVAPSSSCTPRCTSSAGCGKPRCSSRRMVVVHFAAQRSTRTRCRSAATRRRSTWSRSASYVMVTIVEP